MAALIFEIRVIEKSGATLTLEADTREAAEDIAQRLRNEGHVAVEIVEMPAQGRLTPEG
ncbi:hypothetical protein [Aestuariivirga litoralis]|uniref:hypothetical protein n=1 Tax=Aestuariivirga litoralis TaxID=2650924 RepID=UPI0018C6EF49|nr:hypothetical protein [Aestuariivirga litoralis]